MPRYVAKKINSGAYSWMLYQCSKGSAGGAELRRQWVWKGVSATWREGTLPNCNPQLAGEVLGPDEGREALDEVNCLLRHIHPREHVQDGAHKLPRPGHWPLVTAEFPVLFFCIFRLASTLRRSDHKFLRIGSSALPLRWWSLFARRRSKRTRWVGFPCRGEAGPKPAKSIHH